MATNSRALPSMTAARQVRRFAVSAALIATLGCAGGSGTVQTPQPPPAAAPAIPDSIRWVRDAAEFRAAVVQTYRMASTYVETAVAGRAAGTWAVVLDADETVLSNRMYQEERARAGLAYDADSWRKWVARREATPLPGAADFLARVRALGGHIAIVTNRRGEAECRDTEAVFRSHQLAYDAMLCRDEQGPSDKNPRFQRVAEGATDRGTALEIVAFLGDNILDFPGLSQESVKANDQALDRFGRGYFMLPNPMYGSWNP